MKYEVLINILDSIRNEATEKHSKRYLPPESEPESINNSRARAYIHLYLKVLFGMLNFEDRERLITDGSYDGGVDGYYIEKNTKCIYLIQSKFRTSAHNYESKKISLDEILHMDVNRILEGEQQDESGNNYNGKIKQLQREVSALPDVGRYSYKVVLLANVPTVSAGKLRMLTGGYSVEVYDYDRSYRELVYPVVSGTYFTATDISIPIDLSNKNSGSKISYTVSTKISDCEITVLFVPIIEIAKMMGKYKNSILKYNPRSYLDLDGQNVNQAIRETVLKNETNEFALYNNGITMLSDETYINERIGQKNKAQLTVKNPQIINGGQTSFTLSRILHDCPIDQLDVVFGGKEVLLKVITLIDNSTHSDKLQLIEDISNATNKQTPVNNADRYANETFHQSIQSKVFDSYGIFYERKRGEFSDGVHSGYIKKEDIVERNQFFRIIYSANGMLSKGMEKKLFARNNFSEISLSDNDMFDKFNLGLRVFRKLVGTSNSTHTFPKVIYAKVYMYVVLFSGDETGVDEQTLSSNLKILENKWSEFVNYQSETSLYGLQTFYDRKTGETRTIFSLKKFSESKAFEKSILSFIKNGKTVSATTDFASLPTLSKLDSSGILNIDDV